MPVRIITYDIHQHDHGQVKETKILKWLKDNKAIELTESTYAIDTNASAIVVRRKLEKILDKDSDCLFVGTLTPKQYSAIFLTKKKRDWLAEHLDPTA